MIWNLCGLEPTDRSAWAWNVLCHLVTVLRPGARAGNLATTGSRRAAVPAAKLRPGGAVLPSATGKLANLAKHPSAPRPPRTNYPLSPVHAPTPAPGD